MSVKEEQLSENMLQQNVWFGISMFLIGIIVGVILVAISGVSFTGSDSAKQKVQVAAPNAPTAPQAPQVSIRDTILSIAQATGLDEQKFTTCLDADAYKQMFADEESDAQKAGVNGTPGNILVDLKSGNSRVLSGAQPFSEFQKNIDEMLKNPTAKSTDPNAPAATGLKPVDFAKDHFLGSKDAKLALIEYTDYQCPFCHRVHPTLQQMLKQYDGKVVWVLRHFPLSFHPNAIPLATAAECANEIAGPEAFWNFTDKVMVNDNVN